MTTRTELAASFDRLEAGLDWLDNQPDGHDKAKAVRSRVAEYLNHTADGFAGRHVRCKLHPGENLAHNCGPCRSERIGLDPDAVYNPAALPETPAGVLEHEARKLGESQ